MSMCQLLALSQISICVFIGIFFGLIIMHAINYKREKNQLNRIYELEQILDDNKIWIKN